jgi:hypothetical protein
MKIVVNCTENTQTTQELTEKEIADKVISKNNFQAKLAAQDATQEAKQAILNRLGLTAEEAAILLS